MCNNNFQIILSIFNERTNYKVKISNLIYKSNSLNQSSSLNQSRFKSLISNNHEYIFVIHHFCIPHGNTYISKQIYPIQDDKYPMKCPTMHTNYHLPTLKFSNSPYRSNKTNSTTACYTFRFWLLARFQSPPLPHLARRWNFNYIVVKSKIDATAYIR